MPSETSNRALLLLRRITLDQWAAIDRQHRQDPLPSLKSAAVLLTATLALIIPKYFGSPSSFDDFPFLVRAFSGLPYPDLHPHLFWAGFKLVHYGLLPYLCIRLVLKDRVASFGARIVWEPKIWLLYLSLIALVLPLTYLASSSPAFLRTYPKYAGAGDSLQQFFTWEIAYAFQFVMLEFFFRGFLCFALARSIGSLAVFVMVVPYAMIHLNKPPAADRRRTGHARATHGLDLRRCCRSLRDRLGHGPFRPRTEGQALEPIWRLSALTSQSSRAAGISRRRG